jgi:putative oxidoreductase
LAGVFIFHGLLKLTNLSMFAEMLPISFTTTLFVALAELSGGVLILIGGLGASKGFDLATRAGAALNIPVMIGAITLVHWGQWNFLPSQTHPIGGIEFQTVLILIMLYIAITGNNALQQTSSPAGFARQSV